MTPITQTLRTTLREELRDHPILIWLDKDSAYSTFVDELRSEPSNFPAPVIAHRGSYLESMMALEAHGSGIDPSPLLLHLPQTNEDSVRETPFYETYAAGFRFRKSLSTLIREAAFGRVPRDEVDAFLAEGDYTLESADAWMAQKLARVSGELQLLLGSLNAQQFMDQLLSHQDNPGGLRAMLGDTSQKLVRKPSGHFKEAWNFTGKHLGLDTRWPAYQRLKDAPEGENKIGTAELAELVAGWALCVEYTHDLRGRKPAQPELAQLLELAKPLRENCCELAEHLRTRHADFYAQVAASLEDSLAEEREQRRAEELGRVDTFRFEEEQLLQGALQELGSRAWTTALRWANERLDGGSFWLRRDVSRRNAWLLVRGLAQLGLAIQECKLEMGRAVDLGDAARLYAEGGAVVDRRHRHLEQQAEALLYRGVPHYPLLRSLLNAARSLYRDWSDQQARAFTKLCEQHGALPAAEYQQRRIFEDVVLPSLDDKEKTALFLVDALRFEMAQELLELLGKAGGARIKLDVRLAELPSVTEVGMNVLAPVLEDQVLRPAFDKKARRFDGFKTSSYRVRSPKDREKAIRHRAGGDACPWKELEEVLGSEAASLKASVMRADRLMVVHSIEIDAAGEKGAGLSVFEGTLRKIERALTMLHEAGIRRFVLTSDHGFLLRNPGDPTLSYGKQTDPLPRYVLSPHRVSSPEHLSIPLRSLEYQGSDAHLLTPRGTEVHEHPSYDARNFVHGGNSPQERFIPVMTIRHRRPPGSDTQRYLIEIIRRMPNQADMHCIQARVAAQDQMGLAFTGATELEIELRVLQENDLDLKSLLCQASQGATMQGGIARVRVGQPFLLYFRLTGAAEHRAKIELRYPGAHYQVQSASYDERFEVEVRAPKPSGSSSENDATDSPPEEPAKTPSPSSGTSSSAPPTSWLEVYEDLAVRKVFSHIDSYGSISEQDAMAMLGGARQMRRFSRRFEEHAAKAPFTVNIDTSGGSKTYSKQGQRKS